MKAILPITTKETKNLVYMHMHSDCIALFYEEYHKTAGRIYWTVVKQCECPWVPEKKSVYISTRYNGLNKLLPRLTCVEIWPNNQSEAFKELGLRNETIQLVFNGTITIEFNSLLLGTRRLMAADVELCESDVSYSDLKHLNEYQPGYSFVDLKSIAA